jgi:hypothetical protein
MKTIKSFLFAGFLSVGFLAMGCGAKVDAEKVGKCVTGGAKDEAECTKCCKDAGATKGTHLSAAGINTCACTVQ